MLIDADVTCSEQVTILKARPVPRARRNAHMCHTAQLPQLALALCAHIAAGRHAVPPPSRAWTGDRRCMSIVNGASKVLKPRALRTSTGTEEGQRPLGPLNRRHADGNPEPPKAPRRVSEGAARSAVPRFTAYTTGITSAVRKRQWVLCSRVAHLLRRAEVRVLALAERSSM